MQRAAGNFCRIGRGLLLAVLFLLSSTLGLHAQKIYRGFDGGMMLHTGYLYGSLAEGAYSVKGAPFGVGGAIRVHLGAHFRLGGEGYVSSLKINGNDSYLKYGWGGLLADAYTVWERFQPYVGVTLGGGAMTTLLMTGVPAPCISPSRPTGSVRSARASSFPTAPASTLASSSTVSLSRPPCHYPSERSEG